MGVWICHENGFLFDALNNIFPTSIGGDCQADQMFGRGVTGTNLVGYRVRRYSGASCYEEFDGTPYDQFLQQSVDNQRLAMLAVVQAPYTSASQGIAGQFKTTSSTDYNAFRHSGSGRELQARVRDSTSSNHAAGTFTDTVADSGDDTELDYIVGSMNATGETGETVQMWEGGVRASTETTWGTWTKKDLIGFGGLRDSSPSEQFVGAVAMVIMWEDAIPEGIHHSLGQDPFQIFEDPAEDPWFPSPEFDAAIAGSTAFTFDIGAALAGAGELIGSTELAFDPGGLLTANGAIIGSTELVFDIGGVLEAASVPNDIAGSTGIAFDISAFMAATGALLGATDLTFGAGALAKGAGVLAGSTELSFDPGAALAAEGQMVGSTELLFDIGGLLANIANAEIAGSTALTFGAGADLRRFPHVISYLTTSIVDNTTNWVLSVPSANAKDMLVGVFVTDGTPGHSWPAGWDIPGEPSASFSVGYVSDQDAQVRMSARYRYLAVNEAANQITLSAGGSQEAAAVFFRVDAGEDPGSTIPDLRWDRSGVGGASTAPDAPSLTPAGGIQDYLWLDFAAFDDGDVTATGFPASYENTGQVNTGGAAGIGLAFGSREMRGTVEDPAAFTLSGAQEWVAFNLVIYPTELIPGAIAGSLGLAFDAGGLLQGDGILAGSTELAFDVGGVFAGAGALQGSAEIQFDIGATLTDLAAGAIRGSLSVIITGSGSLQDKKFWVDVGAGTNSDWSDRAGDTLSWRS